LSIYDRMKTNACAQLLKKHRAEIRFLQDTCPHLELTPESGEMTSDCRNRTGRSVQVCLECNKVVKFKTHCQQCWAKSLGWPPFDPPPGQKRSQFKQDGGKHTPIDETTACQDLQRTYRGWLCKDCLPDVPESDKNHLWTGEDD
jgi:hypothetical protein